MIRLSEPASIDWNTKLATCSIFADSKSDVEGDIAEKLGLPAGVKVAFGSSVMTADAEVAFLKSDGSWNWPG